MSHELNNLLNLDGKVIVITGASGLLGRKHAEAVAAYGGHPVLLDLSADAVVSMADDLNKQFGVNASGYQVDITDEARIEENVNSFLKSK